MPSTPLLPTLIERQTKRTSSTATLSVYNPSTFSTTDSSSPIAHLPLHTSEDIHSAMEKSYNAWKQWQHSTVYHRAELLNEIVRVMIDMQSQLADIIHLENGKPLCEAKAEVQYSIGFFKWYAALVQTLSGRITPSPQSSMHIETHFRSLGVCAAITPWNFPLAMLAKKSAAAIAAGCTLIAKPSELTPISGLALEHCILQAGAPEGLFTIIVSDTPNSVGELFCSTAFIRKLSFTGSTAVGKLLMSQSAENVQKVSMELGGNAPFVVLQSANLDTVTEGLIRSKFRNSGQACISANRIIVESSIADEFLHTILPVVQSLTPIRHATNPDDADIGPLISPDAVQKVQRLISDALSKGARILFGESELDTTQCWIDPIILSNITPNMDLWWEEIFGPVIACCVATDALHAVELANQSHHGLGAYIFTSDVDQIHQLPGQINSGMVGVNTGAISMPQTPFGGINQSGFGREGAVEGLMEYLSTQTIFRSYTAQRHHT